MELFDKLKRIVAQGFIPLRLEPLLSKVCENYLAAIEQQGKVFSPKMEATLSAFLDCIALQIAHPYLFALFHEKVCAPFDYYTLGLDFFRPLIDFAHSQVRGLTYLEKIVQQVAAKENVILFANHQTEPDPQIIHLLLEERFSSFVGEMIFVAGHRVVTDPLAVPFSLGRNLLCIYSKKYIDTPPELKEQKQLHNQRTMKRMSQLLEEGGKCIYVAPSGGRDRPNAQGIVEVGKFDAQSIELFWLIAKQAKTTTHFYPLALATYHLTPPPDQLSLEREEPRKLNFAPAHLAFGKEIDMENFPGSNTTDKKLKRQKRADAIYEAVVKEYALLY